MQCWLCIDADVWCKRALTTYGQFGQFFAMLVDDSACFMISGAFILFPRINPKHKEHVCTGGIDAQYRAGYGYVRIIKPRERILLHSTRTSLTHHSLIKITLANYHSNSLYIKKKIYIRHQNYYKTYMFIIFFRFIFYVF